MTGRQRLAVAGAALALIGGIGGVAYAVGTEPTASCTPSPTITDTPEGQGITLSCTWPKPAPVTETQTVTATPPTVTETVTQTVTSTTSAPVTTTTTTPPVTTTTPATTTTTTTASPVVWPDASTTGVPTGTVLTNRAGGTLSTPGAIYDGINFTGTVRITANNVVIKNSKVTGSGYDVVKVIDGLTGVRLERVEIDGRGKSGTSGSNGVYGDATLIGLNIHGVENGIQPSDGNMSLRDSWIHDLDAPGSPHIDGVQIDGARANITVEHNVVDLRGWTQTAAVMIDNYFGSVNNVTVNNNRLLGGGYTTYIDARFGTNQCSGSCGGTGGPVTNVRYTNNRIGYGYWGFGTISGLKAGDSYTWTGNVDDKTGNSIPQP